MSVARLFSPAEEAILSAIVEPIQAAQLLDVVCADGFAMHRRSLNRCLARLERAGAIVRVGRPPFVWWVRARSIYLRNGWTPPNDDGWTAMQRAAERPIPRSEHPWRGITRVAVNEARAKKGLPALAPRSVSAR